MEKLHCKACGCTSMIPMDVIVDRDDDAVEDIEELLEREGQESRFYTCHVCGDNWLSVKETVEGDTKVTFVHQMGMSPELKRVAHVDAPIVLSGGSVDHWEYYVDGEVIDKDIWYEKLTTRRRILKSICSN